VWMFLGLTSVFVLVVFLIMGFNSLLNRNGKARKNFTVAGIALFPLIVSLVLNGSLEEKASTKPIWAGEYNGLYVTVNSYEVGKDKHTGKPKLYINVTIENTADYSFSVRFRGEHARVVDPNYTGNDLVESGELREYDLEAYVPKDDEKEVVLSFVLYDMNKDKLKYLDAKLQLNK
jgi:hypothetical protein